MSSKLYLEYIRVGIYNSMDDYGYPPSKILRHPLNKCTIGTHRSRETATAEYMVMLNSEKTKTNDYKAITEYEKLVKCSLPTLSVYKDSTKVI